MTLVTKSISTVLPIAAAAGLALATALAVGAAAPAAAATHHAKARATTPAHHAGYPLYDAAPQGRAQNRAPVNSDDPALTGGGSLGYNQNIYNW